MVVDDTFVQFYPRCSRPPRPTAHSSAGSFNSKECMGYGIGSLLSLVVSVFARSVGFDRDRAFYPTVLIVIASYYVLFAVMGGSTHALLTESIVMTAFLIAAVTGFKSSRWIVVVALVA